MRSKLFATFLILVSCAAAEAAPCKAGTEITLEGEIIIPPVIDGGEWFWPGKIAGKPCQVTTLRGKGKLPPECVPGKSMTLTGRVTDDGILTLQVGTIRCF